GCSRGDDALNLLLNEPFDAVVLDVMLPGRDGLSVLRALREAGRDVPVLLLTARSGLEERLEGLNRGADDYLPKPFYMEELIARLHAITRRREGRAASLIRIGNLKLDLLTREVHRGDELIETTARE
ncbi:response regulator, partial [Arthrospira platensis SPKY1]|nr:response regulator [Arthrospira platensis SPKY1]